MAIKILTKNAVDNTNIDGARQNHFNAGMRSGIVKGAFNEGNLFASSSNVLALDTCELRISGHQIVIDEIQTFTMGSTPTQAIRYSLIAEISVDNSSVPNFRLFIQNANTELTRQNLFANNTGNGIYQIEIGRFTLTTNNLITDIVRTADLITGAGQNGYDYINIGNVITNIVESGVDAEVDVENRVDEESGEMKTDFTFNIPQTAGTLVSVDDEPVESLHFTSDPQTQLNEANDDINLLEQNKQDILTFDNEPTQNSNNPVKSSGLYGVEKVETVYDMLSDDISINWGYTSGIPHGTTITGKNFSKYKRLKLFIGENNGNICGTIEINLTFSIFYGNNFYGTNVLNVYKNSAILGFAHGLGKITTDKTSLLFETSTFETNGTVFHNLKLLKIEGGY